MQKSAVWNQELCINPGSLHQFVAYSGKGKSSLLKVLYGIQRNFQGGYQLDDVDVKNASSAQWTQWRQQLLGYIPQSLDLFDQLSVWENIELQLQLSSRKTADEAQEMLKTLDVMDIADKKAGLISYGQKQRVAIVRALCQPFRYLLLDEPFGHLDNERRSIALDLIKSEAAAQDAAVLLTAHHNIGDKTFATHAL